MARQMPDMGIAAALNRAGKTTTKGHSWTRTRVASLRKDHNIVVYREGERAERGEVTLDEAAEALSVSPATVRRLIVEGALPANQSCKGGPWAIRASDLGRAEVAREAERRRKRSRIGPPSEDEPELGACLLNPGELGFEPLKPVGEPDAANSRIRFDVRVGGSFAAIVRCTVSEVAKLSRLRVRQGTGSAPGRASRYCGRGRRGPTRWRPSRRRARETDGSRAPA